MKRIENKTLLLLDKSLIILTIIAFGVFRPDYVVIGAFLFLIPYLGLTDRGIVMKHMILATIIAAIWSFFARSEYHYNYEFFTISGINVFPFFGWAAGLVGVYLIFVHYKGLIHENSALKQSLLFVAIFWVLLIIGETVAYHAFDLQNLATAQYAGLPICNCMHAPTWMKLSYFLLGPLFFGISWLFGWEK